MEHFKEIAAWITLASIFIVLLIALVLGLKAIWQHFVGYGTYKLRQRENQEEIAAYREKIKALELKAKAVEPVV